MIDGDIISTGGVFKTKKQAERAIYYTESALDEGSRGRYYTYEEGSRYGYSAVDKYKGGSLHDTVMADLTRKGAAELIDMLTKANQAGKGSKKSNPRRNTGISHFEHIRKKPKRYGRIKVEVMGYKQGEYYLVAYTPYLIGEGKRTISDTTRYDKKYRTKAQANEAAKKLRAFIRGGGDYKSLAAMKKIQ